MRIPHVSLSNPSFDHDNHYRRWNIGNNDEHEAEDVRAYFFA